MWLLFDFFYWQPTWRDVLRYDAVAQRRVLFGRGPRLGNPHGHLERY